MQVFRRQAFKCEKTLESISSFARLAPFFAHEQNRLRSFIKERRSCRQDLNRKRYQRLLIYRTETAQHSQFSHNNVSLVRSALHSLMRSPATRRVEGKPELALVGVSVPYCIAWRGNRHGTHNRRNRRVTHARLQWTPEVFGTSLTWLRLVSL